MILIIIILIILALLLFYSPKTEHFQWDPLWVGAHSLNCYNETPTTCLNYSNCGFCFNGKDMKCVPGDAQGPFFTTYCDRWMHSDYYDRHIFSEKVTKVVPSWNEYYPEYEAIYPSPVSMAAV